MGLRRCRAVLAFAWDGSKQVASVAIDVFEYSYDAKGLAPRNFD